MVGLSYRDQLPPVVADEFDATIPRIIQSTLERVELSTLTDYVPWTDVPFNITSFGPLGGGNDWAPTQAGTLSHKYMVLGTTMWMQIWTNTATIGAARTALWWAIPAGFRARNQQQVAGTCYWYEPVAGVGVTNQPLYGTGIVQVNFDSSGKNPDHLTMARWDVNETALNTNINAGATAFFNLYATACFEIVPS